jgi:hypothetical protein
MWDIQGVKTGFTDVPSIEPEIPMFDMNKLNVRIYYHKPWYSFYRTVVIEVDGNSLHARQMKDISLSIDNGAFGKPVAIDIDKVTLSFSTNSSAHNLALKIRLTNGNLVENLQRWSVK